jgi:hypothetical protein
VRRYSRVLPTSGNGQSASGDASTVMDNPNPVLRRTGQMRNGAMRHRAWRASVRAEQ